MAMNLFSGGYLPLEQRAHAENLYLGDLRKDPQAVPGHGRCARGPAGARRAAVGHLLLQLLAVPVDPGQLGDQAAVPGDADPPPQRAAGQPRGAGRHHLRLRRQARSVHRSPRRARRPCMLHPFNGEPYYLGVFLVGAYQEILGDLHNLFGDTHAVHVASARTATRAPKARASSTSSRATRSARC